MADEVPADDRDRGKRDLVNAGISLRVSAEARTTEPQGVTSNGSKLELDSAKKKKKKKKRVWLASKKRWV